MKKRLADDPKHNYESFTQLQVWNDANQDAEAQPGELQSLSEAGITSIDLNYVSTNINVNGNLLVEASKYTDTVGNKELAADIQLATDAKDTKVDINDIPDFTIDPITNLLPQLRGSGLVYDSFIRYNMDPEFKAIAVEMSKDTATMATDFDTFIEHYSGYTTYVNQLREKYSQDTFDMVEADKHAWILERFEATNANTIGIESYYNTSLNSGYVPTRAKTFNATMEMKYQSLTDRIESTFAMQSVFGEVFSDTHYDLSTQSFIIDNTSSMNTKITEYFNSTAHTIEEKLYLAKVMQMQQGGLVYDIDTFVQSIDNDIVQSLVSDIYTGTALSAFETKESYTTDGIIIATDADELITLSDADTKILLREGNDTLTGNGGDDYMEGGTGYDKYIAGNGDTIMDSDRSGVVLFEGTRLTKGVAKTGECSPDGDGTYKGDGGVYTLSGGKLTFTKDSGKILTIQKFVNGALGITLTNKDPGGSCPPPPPPSPTPGKSGGGENFSSPLVLDLNGDGVTSTFISEGSTHFDLDSNGTKERTGWVQNTDALLVFERNQDGIINNGSELFGNNTTLKNGTLAANGFEALKEYIRFESKNTRSAA